MNAPRVGIIGAGQLGRMMALAAYPLGIECRFLDTRADAPGGQIAPIRVAALDDEAELAALAREVDVLTFDIENVSVTAVEALTGIVPVRPSPAIIGKAQDRLAEKRLFESLGMPTARYATIDRPEDVDAAGRELGWPIVLKTRRLGYDGRGQRIARSAEELGTAWDALGGLPAIAEAWIDFEREVSLIGVRGPEQELAFYALSENRHRDGMLESSIAPFADDTLEHQARAWMAAMMQQHDYCGVLTIEFFVAAGRLMANEIAPRVHNSGHWTIEGAETSQFENHVRAILGLPLGCTRARGAALMRNLIGRLPPKETLLAIEGLHLHVYGKEPRPRRKLGHCTLLAPDRETLSRRLLELESVLGNAPR
ncbi:MAG TPA: 5-(carboxyamino)imidazole ribonucleotide synthase [Gammaproteobacteria bacterium]|nr:5-(carboxyamino)imidazole ribonucleotide synthase [Gammaproteobacteria bacterium]